MRAVRGGHVDTVKLLLKSPRIAVDRRDAVSGLQRRHLQQGAATHSAHGAQYGRTALIWAAQLGHSDMVQMLLQTRAVNVNATTVDRATALMFASANGNSDMVRMLLNEEGVQVNMNNSVRRLPATAAPPE